MQEKVRGFGVGSVWAYAALTLFYSAIHSGLEEYYWRWFVFGQLRQMTTPAQGDHGFQPGIYGPSCDRAGILFRLAVALSPTCFRCPSRGGSLMGLALRPHRFLGGTLAESSTRRRRIFIVGYDIIRHTL